MQHDVLEFEGAEPEQGGEPFPFAITMHRLDGTGKVRQTFLARPRGQVSYGALVAAVDKADGNASLFEALDRIVVAENSDPQDSDDDRTEAERLRDHVGHRDLMIDGKTLSKIVESLVEKYADDTPTKPSRPSSGTRRPAARGSAARPSRPR